jgi:hypothetical protein
MPRLGWWLSGLAPLIVSGAMGCASSQDHGAVFGGGSGSPAGEAGSDATVGGSGVDAPLDGSGNDGTTGGGDDGTTGGEGFTFRSVRWTAACPARQLAMS